MSFSENRCFFSFPSLTKYGWEKTIYIKPSSIDVIEEHPEHLEIILNSGKTIFCDSDYKEKVLKELNNYFNVKSIHL